MCYQMEGNMEKKNKKKDQGQDIKIINGNVAKSSFESSRHSKNKKENAISRAVGIVLLLIQLVATGVLAVGLLKLNLLPELYVAIIVGVLVIIWGAIFAVQLKAKKKAIVGKVISVILSIVLFAASYYVFISSSALGDISGGDVKTDSMIVVVRADDSAETIEDAASYNFGVQYTMFGDDVKSAIAAIEAELGSSITVTEYNDLAEQEAALMEGSVDAIIYNEAYTSFLLETDMDYLTKIKVIYTHDIDTKIEADTTEVEVQDDTFAVLISGIDIYGSITKNSRSDVNILAVVNPITKQVLLVNTPRDFYVTIPEITGDAKDKLTHAGIYGVDRSMATIAQLYDTEVEFYARVNFTSLIEMVDALGGIDVYSEYGFTTIPGSGSVRINKGMNHLNGKEALAFSRERYNVPDGDLQRGKNQQAVITAMIQKAISPAIITGANELIASVSGNVETNMSEEQIQELIKAQIEDGATWNIQSISVWGESDSQYCYSYAGGPLYVIQPDQASVDAAKAAIASVENGEIIPQQ